MNDAVTLDRVFVLAKQLPLAEKVRLIEWIAPQIERELLSSQHMPDRIIAATAQYLGLPLISRDRKIRLSAVETIW